MTDTSLQHPRYYNYSLEQGSNTQIRGNVSGDHGTYFNHFLHKMKNTPFFSLPCPKAKAIFRRNSRYKSEINQTKDM